MATAHARHGIERPPGVVAQPAEQQADSSNAAKGQQDVRVLELGKPIERELAGGQSHTYEVTLSAGQFLNVVVEQRGIDVVVKLLGPDSKQIAEFDSEIRKQGQETMSQVAEVAGSYRLNVQAKQKEAPAGGYEIRVVELRAATEKDRALQEARNLLAEFLRLYRAGKYDEALPLAERALEIREKALGPDHPDIARSLNNLAILYHHKGDHAKAELLYQRGLAIWEEALGPDHPELAPNLNNLGALYFDKGDYAKAEPLYQRALAIREKALGPDHPGVAGSLNELAILYGDKGDYAKAEPLHQRALAIWEKALGPDHPRVAISLLNLANVYYLKGDYAKAEPLYQRALAIKEKTFGPEHPDVALTLNNLAALYYDKGDYAKAEPLDQRALAIRKKTLGPEHPDVAQSLNHLANLYYAKGDYAKAQPLCQRALAIGEKTLGPEHPNVALSLNSLAYLYYAKADYAQAEPLFLRTLAIWEKALGPDHPYVARSLNGLAILYAAKGDVAQAVMFQSRASKVSERNIALNLATGSERQKLAYLATLSAQADQTISLHLHAAPNDPTARSLATTTILQRKGRALDAMSDSLSALRRRFNPQDQALLDQLTDARSQLARLVLGGPQRTTPEQHQSRIKTLEEQVEKLEAVISQRSDEFRVQSQPITIEAVQSAIPANTAVIEFFSYRPFNAKYTKPAEAYGQPRYVAHVLRRQGASQWVELGEAKEIDDAIAALRKALYDPKRRDVKRLARSLDKKVFQPVRALLGEATQLLISPDGALNLTPFAALVDEGGRYLVHRYSFSYLTSGRDLLRLQVLRESKGGPLIVADPAFGEMVSTDEAGSRGLGLPKASEQSATTQTELARLYFRPLSGTADEARALKTILPQAKALTGEQATEKALKQSSAPSILHIATHGFFLKDLEAMPADTRGLGLLGEGPTTMAATARLENPLLRSGLALAGANQHKSGDDDGVLTAMEAAALDLWGTKLVVLSACNTGVGEVKNGDGVYGLRRALVLAGAETQVMSLWPVSDQGTRELMVEYYNGLKAGKGRSEALRQVQLRMQADPRRQHPYYWASFIVSGEWANLDGRR
jgi:CHAT domain-containing protein/Tfp pilus assembly protein PilF